jgi:hypothetical protein
MCYGSSEFDPEMTDEEIEEAEQAERDYWEEAELDYYMNRAARETDAAEEPTDEANDDEKSVQGEASQDQPAARIKAPPFPTPCAHGGHTGRVRGVLLTADNRVVSWGQDATIRIWNLAGSCDTVLTGHTHDIRGVVALDETRFLFWDARNAVFVWDPESPTSQKLARLKRPIDGARVLPDRKIVLWCDNAIIYIVDESGTHRDEAHGHEGRVSGVLDLRISGFLSWGTDGTIRLWSNQGESKGVWYGHAAGVATVTELSDGRIVSIDSRNMVIIWNPDGTKEKSIGIEEVSSHLDAATSAVISGGGEDSRTLVNPHDGSIFDWHTRGVIRHKSARGNPLMLFGIPDDTDPIECVGDFSVLTIKNDLHAVASGFSCSPEAYVRWWPVRSQAPQRKPHMIAARLNKKRAALESAGQNLHVTIRSPWGVEILEALDRGMLSRITGVQCTSVEVFFAMAGVLPELELDILQLSYLPGTEVLENLYALQVERLLFYECADLLRVRGTNCLVSEVAVVGCPRLQPNSHGVYVTGPAEEAAVMELRRKAGRYIPWELEDSVPF